jgi:WD40 repeat protein
MSSIVRTSAFLSGFLLLGLVASRAGEESTSAKIEPLDIRPESLSIKPGAAMSARALVTHPPAIRGLLSWTIETRRHRGTMYGLAPSPNGRLLATGGLDGMVRIWKLDDGQLLRVLVGHDSYSGSVAWSPCGTVLASGGTWDGTVRLWEPKSGRPLRVFRGLKGPVGHVAWSPDGRRLVASSGISGAVWMWNAGSDKTDIITETGQYIAALVWAPDGKRLATLSSQAGLALLDMAVDSSTEAKPKSLGNQPATCVAWSPDGQRVATGSGTDCSVWDVSAGRIDKKLAGACLAAAWSPDGTQLAVATTGYAVQIRDVGTGQVAVPVPAVASSLVWHPQTGKLLCGYATQFCVFDPAEKKVTLTVPTTLSQPPQWTANRPLVTGLMTSRLVLWDGATGKRLRELSGHTAAVSAVAWSRDGKRLASASHDKTIRVWDVAKGESVRALEGHTAAVNAVSWSPNSKLLASAGNDNSVRLWDVDDASCHSLESHAGPVRVLAWSPLGNQLISGGTDTKVIVWDPRTRKAQRTITAAAPVLSLACTMLNKTLTLACGTTDEQLQIIDLATGQLLLRLHHGGSPPSVTALAWLPQSSYLLAGRGNHTAQLWDLGSNKVVHNFQAMAPVAYAIVAGNGSTLVAGNHDATVRFWDAASGQLYGAVLDCGDHPVLLTCDGCYREDSDQESGVVYVVLTPDGQQTLTGEEFAARFHWRNNPARVKLAPGR